VGHFLGLAAIVPGDVVLDLGSGSGTDSFLSALATTTAGSVVGIDMTDQQAANARRLADESGFTQVEFRDGYIQSPPIDDGTFDWNTEYRTSPSKPTTRPRSTA